MNRGIRHLMVVVIAVATAGLASFGVYRAVTRIPVREVEVAHTFVVVATRSLPPGVRLSAADVRLAAWPQSSPVPGSFSKVDAVVRHALLASVVENEPIVQGKLASLEEGAGLPPVIPPGMRAMSVKVNDVIGVAGFLDSGTRVDLVVTVKKREESTSKTVVSNVEVISAGTRYQQEKSRRTVVAQKTPSNAAPAAPPAVVTLLVTPTDAERIALAQAEGQIVLALRNPLDAVPTRTPGVRSAALLESDLTPPPVPVVRKVIERKPVAPPEPVVAAKPYMVETIRDMKRKEEEVVQ